MSDFQLVYKACRDADRDFTDKHLNALRRLLPVCPACGGDGRIPDKTSGGHHGTCKTCGGTGQAAS